MDHSGRRLLVLSTALFTFLSPSLAAAEKTESMETSLRPLMEQAAQIQVKLPEENPEGRGAAEDLFRIYQSDAFQKRIRVERQRLAAEFFGEKRGDRPDTKATEDDSLISNERFYLFVSSSVPLATLRTYAADLARLNDPRFVMVLRGFVGGAGRIGPTTAFVADVLKANPDCDLGTTECPMRDISFIVDPLLFRNSGITQVPALVYLPDVKAGEPLIVYGDASIGYALELMARETGNKGLGQLAERMAPIP